MNFDMSKMTGMLKKMQDDMAQAQEELGAAVITGGDPSGKVIVKCSGHKEILEVKIDPSVIDPSDPEMLEDLVMFAVRDTLKKAEEHSQQVMGKLTSGLPKIPGLQMPF